MENEIRPGRYRHFKGKEYEVLYLARHSETEEEMVVYRALYGDYGVRPPLTGSKISQAGADATRPTAPECVHTNIAAAKPVSSSASLSFRLKRQ